MASGVPMATGPIFLYMPGDSIPHSIQAAWYTAIGAAHIIDMLPRTDSLLITLVSKLVMSSIEMTLRLSA